MLGGCVGAVTRLQPHQDRRWCLGWKLFCSASCFNGSQAGRETNRRHQSRYLSHGSVESGSVGIMHRIRGGHKPLMVTIGTRTMADTGSTDCDIKITVTQTCQT